MEKVKFFGMIIMVTIVMTRVSAEEQPVKATANEMLAANEQAVKVTTNEVTLAAEAAATSFKSSAGEAAEGAKSWADWATNKIRHPGENLEKTPGSE